MNDRDEQPRLLAWGGYDKGKPRVRLLLEALRDRGALAAEIDIGAWAGVEDKSVAGPLKLMRAALRLLASYPGALFKLARQPRDLAILLPYPAIPDIFLVWPIARLRRQTIIVDAFIPLHDTIVEDRGMLRRGSLAARLVWSMERLALRLADIVIVDTDQHGEFYSREFGLDPQRLHTILVGAEPLFHLTPSESGPEPNELPLPQDRPVVLFYGQLIPLHGLPTILDAVRLTEKEPFHWAIVGRGQQEPLLRQFLASDAPDNMSWIPWVDYELLPALIRRSVVALGVFGVSEKAARVIPNKLFQILAAGRPIITRDSDAVRSLREAHPDTIVTVPPGDGEALAEAVRRAVANPEALRPLPAYSAEKLAPESGVRTLLERLRSPG